MFGPRRMRGVMALQSQAEAWMADHHRDLAARGLGFSDEDLAVIAASHVAHPHPVGVDPTAGPGASERAAVMRTLVKTMVTRFPPEGIDPDDRRLAPRHLPLVTYAVAARAVGWSTDPALVERVLTALGADPAAWGPAGEAWTPLFTRDMQMATLYGQLYSHAEPFPRRPGG